MQNMFSDHNGIRHNRKISEKIPNYLKLKKSMGERRNQREIRKYFELNKNESLCMPLEQY